MTGLSEPLLLDAAALMRGYERLDFTPREVTEAFVRRIEADSEINAISEVIDSSLQTADDAGDLYFQHHRDPDKIDLPALLGVPVAVKEKHALRGRTISQGLLANRNEAAAEDHPVVERLRAAGAVMHARTTTPEFSCATVTHSPLWGVTRNPWNLRYSPGGSSGGSGAALAAGMTTLATASDIAGSTRIPAGFTGTFGYKAPYGRVPGSGALAADWYRSDSPMGRSVEDLRLLIAVMAGRHDADHSSLPSPGYPLIEEIDATGLRVGYLPGYRDYQPADRILQAMSSVISRLTDAGSEVVELSPRWDSEEIVDVAFGHFDAILAPYMQREIERGGNGAAPYTERFIHDAASARVHGGLYELLVEERKIQAQVNELFAEADVVICPISNVEQLEADADYLDGLSIGDQHLKHYWQGHFTLPFNIANRCPVVAMPTGESSNEGIPIGLQIVGRPFDEAMVFRVARLLERQLAETNAHPAHGQLEAVGAHAHSVMKRNE